MPFNVRFFHLGENSYIGSAYEMGLTIIELLFPV